MDQWTYESRSSDLVIVLIPNSVKPNYILYLPLFTLSTHTLILTLTLSCSVTLKLTLSISPTHTQTLALTLSYSYTFLWSFITQRMIAIFLCVTNVMQICQFDAKHRTDTMTFRGENTRHKMPFHCFK